MNDDFNDANFTKQIDNVEESEQYQYTFYQGIKIGHYNSIDLDSTIKKYLSFVENYFSFKTGDYIVLDDEEYCTAFMEELQIKMFKTILGKVDHISLDHYETRRTPLKTSFLNNIKIYLEGGYCFYCKDKISDPNKKNIRKGIAHYSSFKVINKKEYNIEIIEANKIMQKQIDSKIQSFNSIVAKMQKNLYSKKHFLWKMKWANLIRIILLKR